MTNLKWTSSIAAATLILGMTSTSFAEGYPQAPVPIQSNNWYVSAFGGAAFTPNTTLDGYTTDYHVGWDAGAGIGYRGGPLRYEGEYIFQYSNIESINDFSAPGTLKANAGMFNVLYDFGDAGAVCNPYIGAGIGYANVAQTDRISQGQFAYQAKAGLGFNIIDNVVIDIGYRYFGTTTATHTLGGRYQNHLLNGGVIYYIP